MFQLPPCTRCRMVGQQWLSLGLLLLCTALNSAQDDLKPPEFPDVFSVEVQGIFHNEQVEVDGSMYYDKINNRAAIFFLYQKVSTRFIYNFNDNEMVNIDGSECTTSPIPDDSVQSFFPFTVDNKKQKQIADPKDVFYFTKSTLERQDLSVIPTYVYTAKLDFPKYGRKDCDVMHVFSKPELELPNCDNHACKSTLMSISVKCETPDDEANVHHTYNFYRFKTGIADTSIFQPPVGVFCNITSHQPFPGFPGYFSFSYDRIEEREDLGPDTGVHSIHKKVWYDSKLKLTRMDEFDEDGLIISSRIFDTYGGTAYTIIASLPLCEAGPLEKDTVLSEMAGLPKAFFSEDASTTRFVYVGKRNTYGLDYDVWSLSFYDRETEATVVEEFYFTKTQGIDQEAPSKMQISHADIYTYEENVETELLQLTMLTHLSINNYRSKPKEWQAFDISSCFSGEQKRGFKLNVTGPSILKDSHIYEDVLERMYMKLIIATNVSVIRISELRGIFDGVDIVAFKGWILDKSEYDADLAGGEKEPDMITAYERIEEAAAAGKLSIKFKKDGKDIIYDVTAVEKVEIVPIKTKKSDCFSGASLAAAGLVLLFIGISFGIAGYYVFLKKRRKPLSIDKIQLTHASEKSENIHLSRFD